MSMTLSCILWGTMWKCMHMLNPTRRIDTLKTDVPPYMHSYCKFKLVSLSSWNCVYNSKPLKFVSSAWPFKVRDANKFVLALVRVPQLISGVALGQGAPGLKLRRFLIGSVVQAIPGAPKIPQSGPKRVILLKLRPASERMTPTST